MAVIKIVVWWAMFKKSYLLVSNMHVLTVSAMWKKNSLHSD